MKLFPARALAPVLVAVLVAATSVAAAPTFAAPAMAGHPATGPAAQASAAGHRVEVLAERTSTRQVWVNPDGTRTSETSVAPRWVRRGTSWVAVDTALTRRADGSVAPSAVPADTTFSGGGTGPLAVVSIGGRSVTTTWPGRLPAPELSGATATYREVLSGVDLRLTATTTGFSEVLVVESRQAAANPALRAVHFGVESAGLTVRETVAGELSAVTATGDELFHSGAPRMWDSREDHSAVMGQHFGEGGQLTLTPDSRLLTGPDVRYPVYLDPDWSGSKQAWTYVDKAFATSPNGLNPSHPYAETGYYNPGVKRSFFRMDTDNVNGKHILSATFRITGTKSFGCGSTYKTRTDLYLTGAISSSTTWNNQPAWKTDLGNVLSNYGYGSCPNGNVEFDVTSAIVGGAAAGWSNTTFGLRAYNESSVAYWKGFDPASARIVISYNSVPSTPASVATIPGTPCVTGGGRPALSTANLPAGAVASLETQLYDPDGTLDNNGVRAEFAMTHYNDATGTWDSFASLNTPFTKSAGWQTARVALPALTEQQSYSWQVRAYDGTDHSAWTSACEFTVDNTPPDSVPQVSSTSYPSGSGAAHGGVGQVGTFTFTAGSSASGVAAFKYALNDPSASVQVPASGGTATVQLVPRHELHNTLYVWAVDAAGNVGRGAATYDFEVGPPADPVAHWAADQASGASVPDSAPPASHTATLAGGSSWSSTGRIGGALHLDGASGVATTTGPVVHTDRSLSVSAWVRLTGTAHNATIVSQSGITTSAFLLYYSVGLNRWAFNMQQTDGMDPVLDRVASDQPPALNSWTHLIGVFDATAHQLRLYVNGVQQSTVATHTTTWDATGPAQLGREKYQGVQQNYLTGDLDDVKIYDRIVSDIAPDSAFGDADAEVYHLATRPVNQEGWWKLDEAAGTSAADSSGHGRSATAAGSPTWEPDGIFGGAVTLNGTSQSLGTSGSSLHTEGSFSVATWVRLDSSLLSGALPAGTATALSQDGVHNSSFFLGLRYFNEVQPDGTTAHVARWCFSTLSADATTGRTFVHTCSALPIDASTLDQWVLLVAVYDVTTRTSRLYVPGTGDAGLKALPTGWAPWQASGGLQIGRAKWTDNPVDYWPGQIDQVRAYSGVLSAAQAADLFQDMPPTAS